MEHKHLIDEALITRFCKGNREAMEFFIMFSAWVHAIDDLVDGIASPQPTADSPESTVQSPQSRVQTEGCQRIPTAKDREEIVAAFAQGVLVLSHPFYLRNIAALRMTVMLIANQYADSVRWEKSDAAEEWQARWADTHRSCGLELAKAIALICGGWELVRGVSAELETVCYWDHHDEQGNQK